MEVNGEAIYETRPWKISGEGPNMIKAGSFQGESVNKLGEKDIRFTRNKASSVTLNSPTLFASGAVRALTIPIGGMVQPQCRRFSALQGNYDLRIRRRTSEYLEFFPVPR
jgi:alpha-L-fucosidase